MRRFTFRRLLRFRPSPFGPFAAAAAFALGLALAGAAARRGAAGEPQCVPFVVAFGTRGEKGARDYSEQETCFAAGSRIEDRYHNYNYGFSVDLPGGMVGGTSPPPAPQHGFGVDLDNPKSVRWLRGDFPESYLYVDGSYNSREWTRLDDAVREHLASLREGGENVRVVGRAKTTLAGLRAVRIVAHYEKDGAVVVSDEIVAFREDGDVVYTVELTTMLSNYERDRPALEEMRKTFCLQPIP